MNLCRIKESIEMIKNIVKIGEAFRELKGRTNAKNYYSTLLIDFGEDMQISNNANIAVNSLEAKSNTSSESLSIKFESISIKIVYLSISSL